MFLFQFIESRKSLQGSFHVSHSLKGLSSMQSIFWFQNQIAFNYQIFTECNSSNRNAVSNPMRCTNQLCFCDFCMFKKLAVFKMIISYFSSSFFLIHCRKLWHWKNFLRVWFSVNLRRNFHAIPNSNQDCDCLNGEKVVCYLMKIVRYF